MNKIEGQSSGFKDAKNNISKRVGAVVLAAGLVVSGVSVGEETESEIRIEGVMPSQKPDFLPEGIGSGGSEAGVAVAPIEITDEYKKEIFNILNDYSQPVPIEGLQNIQKDWKEKTFGVYKEELKEAGVDNEEMLDFGSKLLLAWDKSRDIGNGIPDKIQNYVSREQIVNYALTRQGLNVYCDKDDNPRVLLLNTTEKIDKAFYDAINWYEKNKCGDVLESGYNNGFCILFTAVTDPNRNAGSVVFTEWGIISPNMDEENIKMVKNKEGLRNMMIHSLFVETYGIAHYQVYLSMNSYPNIANQEIVKSLLAGKIGIMLSKQDNFFKIMGDDFIGQAHNFSTNYQIDVNDKVIKREIEFLTEGDFIDPIGFESLREVEGFSDLIDLTKK